MVRKASLKSKSVGSCQGRQENRSVTGKLFPQICFSVLSIPPLSSLLVQHTLGLEMQKHMLYAETEDEVFSPFLSVMWA